MTTITKHRRLKITAAFVFALALGQSAVGSGDYKAGSLPVKKIIDATVYCPVPTGKSPDADMAQFQVGPKDCKAEELGPICRILIMTQLKCTWDRLELGGQVVKSSVWHGQGYSEGSFAVANEGYDTGQLPSGDYYLSRWSEFMLPGEIVAIWAPVFGTGGLSGIAGQATVNCDAPAKVQTDDGEKILEKCSVKGWYSLPAG